LGSDPRSKASGLERHKVRHALVEHCLIRGIVASKRPLFACMLPVAVDGWRYRIARTAKTDPASHSRRLFEHAVRLEPAVGAVFMVQFRDEFSLYVGDESHEVDAVLVAPHQELADVA
jgi:hypothetical protein